eukprot:2653812-Prymnesium_polylepis.1
MGTVIVLSVPTACEMPSCSDWGGGIAPFTMCTRRKRSSGYHVPGTVTAWRTSERFHCRCLTLA